MKVDAKILNKALKNPIICKQDTTSWLVEFILQTVKLVFKTQLK